jgi:hypothetical protein
VTKQDHEREVAEAVIASFPEVSLHELRDAPDVDLLHQDGYHVGMEVVRLVDGRVLSLKTRIQEASKLIQEELRARAIQGVFRIYYDIQEMFEQQDRRTWKRDMPRSLASLVQARGPINLDREDLRTAGVSCIAKIEAEEAPRTSVGCGWLRTTDKGSSLAEIALASKNRKLAGYRAREGARFDRYWLAIASFGPGTVEDGGYSLLLTSQFETAYDRVLLVNHASNGRLVSAQDVTPNRNAL